jgi:CDP-glucose 4,6-dehydratase
LEKLAVNYFNDIYRGRRVLVTGHTGFKGSWLSLWLHELGARVTGIGLDPQVSPSHWNLLSLPIEDRRIDIRKYETLLSSIEQTKPEIVFHLAAQPLVRRSYLHPLETWSTNVVGTANVLEACRQTSGVKAIVVVTTDKCYENREWPWGYREVDALGGHDPYSASKAAAELVSASYRAAFFSDSSSPLLATARAGNVIGGGDWSEDRLIPDLVRAMQQRRSLEVRAPGATRPWQHVLESLSGYLLLGQKLLEGQSAFAGAWNFGPDPNGDLSVCDMLQTMQRYWPEVKWHVGDVRKFHESTLLYLDNSKARNQLRWRPIWAITASIEETISWYRANMERGEVISLLQLRRFQKAAKKASAEWAKS